jgi:hypothetical protein
MKKKQEPVNNSNLVMQATKVEELDQLFNWLDMVRLDKNLFYNLPDLQQTFGDDAGLVMDIIVYLSHSYKNDLFGFSNFSLLEFCNIMGYKKANLQATHPDIKSGKFPAPSMDEHEFKSIFEYTLWRMASRNIPLSNTEKTQIPSMKEVNVKFVQVFSDLKVMYDIKKMDRRVYSYKLGQGFLENMLQFYITMSISNYLKVATNKHKDRIRSLYTHLAGMRHVVANNKITKLTPNFNMLCGIAGVPKNSLPKHKKEVLDKYLKQISEESDLKFKYRFYVAAKQKQAYSLELEFEDTFTFEGERKNIFFSELNILLRQIYVSVYPKYSSDHDLFQKWLNNRSKDIELKQRFSLQLDEKRRFSTKNLVS